MINQSELPLNGIRILVTRPAKQTNSLCSLIEKNGGVAMRLPTINIQAPDDPEQAERLCKRLTEFQIAIFVSRNAVDWAFDLFINKSDIPIGLSIMAIGAGTAERLKKYGVSNAYFAKGRASSEAFLELDGLQANVVQGKRIIIFRGQGGRDVLANGLCERGAHVKYAEVYRRVQPRYDENIIHKLWIDTPPDVIVVTSNEGLQNLFNITAADDHKKLLKTPLVSIGKRMSDLASQLGFVRPPVVARETSDQGLLESMITTVGEMNQ
jgi:uroporphyrinogen-III synthase